MRRAYTHGRVHIDLTKLRGLLVQQVQVQLPGNWVAISQAELDKFVQGRAVMGSKLAEYSTANSILHQRISLLTRQRDDLRAALNHDADATVEDRNFRNKWFNEGYTTALKDRRACQDKAYAALDAQLFARNKR